MSYMKWIPHPGSAKSSLWQWFPWAVVAAMSVVVAVNMGMVYAALHSFPGKAGDEDFELSNHYNRILDRVQREAGLGWTIQAEPDAARRLTVVLTDRNGAPLGGARLVGIAERPLGATQQHQLAFHEVAAGRYSTETVLPLAGQWDLMLSASAQGHDIAATRRIVVR